MERSMSYKVTARIPHKEVWDRLKAYVKRRYGKIHTKLGEELEKAILCYLSSTHTHKQSKKQEITELVKKLKEYAQVTRKEIQQELYNLYGYIDTRTTNKYIQILLLQGFLRPHENNSRLYYINENGFDK